MIFKSPLLSNLPHIRYGFFGKNYDVGQRTQNERIGYAAIQKELGGDSIVRLTQVHTSIVNIIDQTPHHRLTGDALITTHSGIVLCVRSADCALILIAHKTKPIIAAIHAGWKGAVLQKIIENTAHELKKMDHLDQYVMAIGPCLHQQSFDTGPIIYNNVSNKSYFDEKRRFDFPRFVKNKLISVGFSSHNIDTIDVNTYTHDDVFSARRLAHNNVKEIKRIGAAIVL